MSVFNAVGNNDFKAYKSSFWKTYYRLIYNKILFIVLNTESKKGNIVGNQLFFFKNHYY
jgi:hypothetical protein